MEIIISIIIGMTAGILFGAFLAVAKMKSYENDYSESRVEGLLTELETQDKQIAELTKQRDLYKEKVMQYETN